jgi:hypothetical protein
MRILVLAFLLECLWPGQAFADISADSLPTVRVDANAVNFSVPKSFHIFIGSMLKETLERSIDTTSEAVSFYDAQAAYQRFLRESTFSLQLETYRQYTKFNEQNNLFNYSGHQQGSSLNLVLPIVNLPTYSDGLRLATQQDWGSLQRESAILTLGDRLMQAALDAKAAETLIDINMKLLKTLNNYQSVVKSRVDQGVESLIAKIHLDTTIEQLRYEQAEYAERFSRANEYLRAYGMGNLGFELEAPMLHADSVILSCDEQGNNQNSSAEQIVQKEIEIVKLELDRLKYEMLPSVQLEVGRSFTSTDDEELRRFSTFGTQTTGVVKISLPLEGALFVTGRQRALSGKYAALESRLRQLMQERFSDCRALGNAARISVRKLNQISTGRNLYGLGIEQILERYAIAGSQYANADQVINALLSIYKLDADRVNYAQNLLDLYWRALRISMKARVHEKKFAID